jgi:hypothetical protein
MAVLNPKIRAVMIDGALFQSEVEQREIMAVPTVFLNGQVFGQGRMTVEEILAKLDSSAGSKAAEKLDEKAPYDADCRWWSGRCRCGDLRSVKVSAPVSWRNASVVRRWTRWRLKTLSRYRNGRPEICCRPGTARQSL